MVHVGSNSSFSISITILNNIIPFIIVNFFYKTWAADKITTLYNRDKDMRWKIMLGDLHKINYYNLLELERF